MYNYLKQTFLAINVHNFIKLIVTTKLQYTCNKSIKNAKSILQEYAYISILMRFWASEDIVNPFLWLKAFLGKRGKILQNKYC